MGKELKDFNSNLIMESIKNKMPFYNERHFQFELAMAIRDFYKDNKNIQIDFEAYYGTQNETDDNTKRNYTDIVVYDKNGNFIAIELKYCLDDNNNKEKRYKYKNGENEITIAKKGAVDNCRYDFLFDVHRLEQISKNAKYENNSLKNFYCGYTILISNSKKTWLKSKKEHPNDINFHIADGTKTKRVCFWLGGINFAVNKDGLNYKGKQVLRRDFNLKKEYDCCWQPAGENNYYFEDSNKNNPSPPFKYLVIKIEK